MTLVRTEVDGGVAVVTLADPDRRNAISPAMVAEIVAAFDLLDADPGVGAIVVTGEPPAFCAGADLSHLGRAGDAAPAGGHEGLRAVYEGFLRVARSPLPTIAAVNGPAVGAGMNLALCCDLRLAGRSARFDTRFLQLGLHPGGGHTWLLDRAVGPQAAAAAVLFGEVLDGEAAARCGLVWRCVDDADLLPLARELAARAAAAPRPLVERVKASLAAARAIAGHDEAVDAELAQQAWSIGQPWFAARLAALRNRISGS
jgi:enoyl-CoA hydratase